MRSAPRLDEGDMGALRLFLAAAALSIGACAATDHFQQRIDRYDLAAAESRDQMIFTNICEPAARALSFVQMGRSRVRPRRPRRSVAVDHPGAHIPWARASRATPCKAKVFWRQSGRRQWLHRQLGEMNGSTNFQVTRRKRRSFITVCWRRWSLAPWSSSSSRESPGNYCFTCSRTS